MDDDTDMPPPGDPSSTDDVTVDALHTSRQCCSSGTTDHKTYKIVKTTIMITIWIFIGLSSSVITPSVDDLRRQVGCDYEHFTYTLVGRSVGVIAGALSFGLINDKFKGYTDLCIGSELLLGAGAFAAVPWLKTLSLMTSSFALVGFAVGGLSASGNGHVVYMWQESAAAPIHVVHFGFGLGTVLGPVIAGPFISRPGKNHTESTSFQQRHMFSLGLDYHSLMTEQQDIDPFSITVSSQNHSTLHDLYHHDGDERTKPRDEWIKTHDPATTSRLFIPFSICAGLAFCSAFIFFILYCLPRNRRMYDVSTPQQHATQHEARSLRQMLNPGNCAGGDTIYAVAMFTLLIFLYILMVSKDTLVNTFLYVIAVHPDLNFSQTHGVLITTTFWIAYTVSRLICAAIGQFIPIKILLFIEMALALTSQVALVLWGLQSQALFWCTTVAFGFTAGPTFPSGMAFIDRYLNMTPLAFSLLDVGIGVGAIVSNWLTGYLYQHHGAQLLFVVSLACGVAMTIILVAMQLIGSRHGDRYERERQRQETGNIQDVTEPLIQT